jgi:hypothetical protein
MNKIIPLQEMIEEIKKYYNLNDTLLALNLKVTPQTVKGWKDGNIPREKTYNKILEIYNNIINSEEQTKEVTEVTKKKPYEISYLNDGQTVYYPNHFNGQIKKSIFKVDNDDDKSLYEKGLMFDIKEEAEQFLKEQTLIKKIKCWTKEQQGDWKPDWSNENEAKHYMGYHYEDEFIYVVTNKHCDAFLKLPYFKSKEIVRACIDEFGDELLEVFC